MLYIRKIYTYCAISGKFCGTKNNSMVVLPNGIHIRNSQERPFPSFDFVRSTIRPTITSEIPSKTFDIAKIVAMIPAFSPTVLVK